MVCGVSQRKLHYMAALLQSLYRWHGGTLWWRERSDQYYLVNCQRYRAEYGKEKNHYVVFLTVRKVSKKRTFRTKNTSTTSDQQKKPRIRIDLARTRGRSSCAELWSPLRCRRRPVIMHSEFAYMCPDDMRR